MADSIICNSNNRSNISSNVKYGFFGTLLILVIVLISVSLKRLKSTEYGVQYDRWAKVLDDAAKDGGLHPGPPGYKFIKFPSVQINAENEDTCVSRDGLQVRYSVAYQYQMPEEQIVDVIVNYRGFKKWATVVEAAGNSAIQHTCSLFSISNFQNKRGIIQDTMMQHLKTKLEGTTTNNSHNTNTTTTFPDDTNTTIDDDDEDVDDDHLRRGVFARAVSLQLKNVDLPEEYRNAVRQKQAAEEDIALAQNQRLQETTKANTELLQATEEAKKILNAAHNTANVTLTQALLNAEETKFALEREAQVLVQVKQDFGLTTEGVLAYMSNQLYKSLPALKVTTGEPAKISLKDEL